MRSDSSKTTRQQGTKAESGRPRQRSGRRPVGRTPACQAVRRPSAFAGLLCAATLLAWAAPTHAETLPDAVFEVWEQHWTLNGDGSIVYHHKQHVRLNNERAYREFADPRITYNVDLDELEIVNARVLRPDGTYRELPDYSHVQVSPDSSAGWPAFAGIQQHLIVMSGVEHGCVVELEYRLTRPAGATPYLAVDVRLDHQYPVRRRLVQVSAPRVAEDPAIHFDIHLPHGLESDRAADETPGATLERPARRPAATPAAPEVITTADVETLRWKLRDLPAVPDEPNSPPWQSRCARLVFSTAGSTEAWLHETLARIEGAADESELIAELASDWTKDRLDPSDRLRGLQEKLAATFNFVTFDPGWRPANPRPASETLRSNYGLPEEAAAVLLALGRAAGMSLEPGVLVSNDVWTERAPQRALVHSYVVVLLPGSQPGPPGELEIWDPRHGRITRTARWSGQTLLLKAVGQLQRLSLPSWDDPVESRCLVRGTVRLADDGNFSGQLTLRTTGLFVYSENLRSQSAQKDRATALLRRVLPAARIDSFNVTALTPTEFTVEMKIRSAENLKKISGSYWLELAEDGPFMADVPMPLTGSVRRQPVRLTGAFEELIDLVIEWPAAWTLEARPLGLPVSHGPWGGLAQTVSADEHQLKLSRRTLVARRELPAADFLELRQRLNELRGPAGRTLILRP